MWIWYCVRKPARRKKLLLGKLVHRKIRLLPISKETRVSLISYWQMLTSCLQRLREHLKAEEEKNHINTQGTWTLLLICALLPCTSLAKLWVDPSNSENKVAHIVLHSSSLQSFQSIFLFYLESFHGELELWNRPKDRQDKLALEGWQQLSFF